MDDAEHARRLQEILTRPLDPDEPVDAYGTGSDGIDRYDGFGTEVQVTSVAVVPGEHGPQVEVGFLLDVPDLPDVPGAGSVLLPFAAEWREAQGYASPALHAPHLARDVMRGARDHIGAHMRAPQRPHPLPDADEQHALLLEVLGLEGLVEERAPGRLTVRHPRGARELTALVTPEQWEQVLQRHGAERNRLIEHFSELLASGHRDDVFLVFWDGDLVRSVREELPPVGGTLRALLAMQAAGPPALGPNDGWYAYRPSTRNDELPG
jgi:hypothetical protein